MTQPNLLELARAGDAKAIEAQINCSVQPKGITAKASLKDNILQVMLESAQVPDKQTVVPLIRDGLIGLGIQSFKKVKIYGRETGEDFPDWQQELELNNQINLPLPIPETNIEAQSSTSVVKAETNTQLTVQKPSFFGSMFGAVAGAAGVVGSAAVQAGGAVAGAAVETAGVVGSAAVQAGGAVAGAAVGVGGVIGSAALQATERTGYAIDFIVNSPLLQQVKNILPPDWLDFIDKVDIVKAEAEVKKLQQQYPHEQPSDIAHRLMVNKALIAGSSGLVSSFVPGAAAAAFVVDFAANMLLQAEMVYQIACAYGLELKDPARKDEVIAIFGLSFGGSQALKAAGTQALKVGSSYAVKAGFLGFLRNIPVAGAVIGASTNAGMIYALGYAACRFYEGKNSPLTWEATLVDVQTQSEKYIEGAIAQEVVMDQILVHVVLAGNPGKTWEQILPELQTLNLSPASIEAIAFNIKSPPQLETLLNQINRDFAVPLLAQCQKVAQLDGVTTPEEAKVIDTITEKFGIELDFVTVSLV